MYVLKADGCAENTGFVIARSPRVKFTASTRICRQQNVCSATRRCSNVGIEILHSMLHYCYYIYVFLTCYLLPSSAPFYRLLLTGIHPSLQCILRRTSTLSCRSIFARISIQPRSIPPLPQTIHSRCSRCPTSSGVGANIWKGPCTVRTGIILFETVQTSSRSVRRCIKV